MSKEAGVGCWVSPISSELIVYKSLKLSSPTWSSDGSSIIWMEGRPSEGGRNVLARSSTASLQPDKEGVIPMTDITPEPSSSFNVRTTVHEYGGGAYTLTPDNRLFFSNFKDQCVWYQDLGTGEGDSPSAPARVTSEGTRQRFADYSWDASRSTLIAVCEEHPPPPTSMQEGGGTGKGGQQSAAPAAFDQVRNSIVEIDPSSGTVTTLCSGHDFFTDPRPSPDGSKLAWISWDFPSMPWDSTTLFVASRVPGKEAPGSQISVAGGPDISIQQPQWSPDGASLYFISDGGTGWWNLYCWDAATGEVQAVLPMEAEFGWPQWVFGAHSYQLLGDNHILVVYNDPKVPGSSFGIIDLKSRILIPLETGFSHFGSPASLAVCQSPPGKEEGGVGFLKVAAVVAGPTQSPFLAVLAVENLEDLMKSTSSDWVMARNSVELELDPGFLSLPQAIEYPTEGGLTSHMVYYPPANKDFRYPEGTLPPLLVHSHGGPTSAVAVTLSLLTQYFTSRGWAVADIDYGGSTGYGRGYRNRLRGAWGVVDVDDCCNAARYLAGKGLVDPARMCISGGSAGGFTTLASLAFRGTFNAGCSLYGVGDLMLLAEHTHKFESRYLDLLVGPLPQAQAVYDERSPIKHVASFASPIVFFQGDQDAVVPPEQAVLMHEAVKKRGIPTSLVLFKGEQHGFRQAPSIRAALDGELYFYGKVLGFPSEMPDGVEVPVIDNLSH